MSAWTHDLSRLDIGGRAPLFVRQESVSGLGLGKRVLFASDLHLRKGISFRVVNELLRIVGRERPDFILLGGDLVDWSSGLETLQSMVQEMMAVAPVGAVGGNHDQWVGVARVREAILNSGGHWLEDGPLQWGADTAIYGSPRQQRVSARCHILCTHGPRAPATSGTFDLVLSGHLHGGQFVFYERGGRFYPGAFAYRWNGLRFEENGTTLLVSRGVRDTVPLRWNCPREVIVVNL